MQQVKKIATGWGNTDGEDTIPVVPPLLLSARETAKALSRGADSLRSLEPSRDESAARLATKKRIAAEHGFQDWNHAPDRALLEYYEFLKTRAEVHE